MKLRTSAFIAIAACILLAGITPVTAFAAAVELIVNPSDPTCSSNSTPACYTTITDAISAAHNIYTANTASTSNITVESGTYNELITLQQGVSLFHGRETARTILNGGGSGTLITATGVTGVSIEHFTFRNALIGILVSGNSGVSITNNVFVVGTGGTGVQFQGSQNPAALDVTNNTFYLNNLAVVRDSDNIQIASNIFSNNTVNISQNPTSLTQNNITNNDFNPAPLASDVTGTLLIPNTSFPNPDPLFVDIANLDTHLMTGSPCIGNGLNSTDIGAYGGADADTIPFQISGITFSTSSSAISLRWLPNNSYLVGGYHLYYGTSPGVYTGTGATEGPSPITVTTTPATLSGLSTTVAAPSSTTLNAPQVLNESLVLSWPAATGATSYIVSYSTSTFDSSTLSSTTRVNVGNNTSYPLTGLSNGQTYYIAVSAVAQKIYYIAVTALNSGGTGTAPGIAFESTYSAEVPIALGSPVEGALSNVVSSFPEALVAYPPLPNGQHQGCFIATAAYGHYSAPEVQALRDFRDQYLLTNKLGRAFVRWYYEHGPVAAAALDAHPGYKPLVRAALMPAVGASLFMTRTPFILKIGLLLIAGCAGAYLRYRKRFLTSGGGH